MLPYIDDLERDDGLLRALIHFAACDLQCVDDAGAQNTDALSFAPQPFFHDSGVTK